MSEKGHLRTRAANSLLGNSKLPKKTAEYVSEDMPVVGIGASAGGLDACRKLVEALSAGNGMAFILVQHLDPTHESLMVDLLTNHTPMIVCQAVDGMLVEREHFYVIPPGTYLSVADGALHLTQPQERHGARLPFDFLLKSLAEQYGARAIGVILSGTGADGSLGAKAVRDKGGFIIAQDPNEADYDGMPRSAITTGVVDIVLPVAEIPEVLRKHCVGQTTPSAPENLLPQDAVQDRLPEIIELLRTRTAHDFTLYKPGTLSRRIERRMAMAGIISNDMDRYLESLKTDNHELDALAKDLLINVTSFFRDPKVFDLLAEKTIPELVRNVAPDHPLRIWIAGCSTGEETYSLAMLFQEEITAVKRNIKLQVFASDVDPDAVATAREGLYPETIAADMPLERLTRFFSKENHNYRVVPDLRAMVVFAVQDVLADPPFSRLDLVSCRNLLIYLRPEAQAKVISAFHFALREDGILLLGSAEAVGNLNGRFEEISKPARLYRHIGRGRPGELGFLAGPADYIRISARPGSSQSPSRQSMLAELCRRLVMESYAPAAILINAKHECLYSLGPTDRYLRVAPGHPTHDLFAMLPQGVGIKLRSAIQRANETNTRVLVAGGRINHDGHTVSFGIDVQLVKNEGEALLLICFADEPTQIQKNGRAVRAHEIPKVAVLEQELEATRTELREAIRNLEISSEEQKAINEEALSINEEFQSTNEELITSKEELQSLNEELTALNGQLQETLERQRTTSDDLQNILYSTNVATIFLDTKLNIRFFTPATKSLFNVIPSDLGRPLLDLSSLAVDSTLATDARKVLKNLVPVDQELQIPNGTWFMRRILPYLTHDNGVGGVVITFSDITQQKSITNALESATRKAEMATDAKSRFLAAASHDLRQPLQTLTLVQGMLAKIVEGEVPRKLVMRLDETLGAMSGMLNSLLDINQIETGTIHADLVDFLIDDLLIRLRDEYAYLADAQGLGLRVVPCGLAVRSDPRLLEQMIRNLLANAFKYTRHGKILLGCRRYGGMLSIEVWDTGIGIPDNEIHAIFEEYHQLGNAARERSRGLGLGLSIVQRLAKLLGHKIKVRSSLGRGSVFTIEAAISPDGVEQRQRLTNQRRDTEDKADEVAGRSGMVLVVEDDPDVRELLELFLKEESHNVIAAPDGPAALELVKHGTIRPDLVLSDYNLPNGMNGLQFIIKLREMIHHQIPAIILTGDISTITLREIASLNCIHLNKPMKLQELTKAIQRLLAVPPAVPLFHNLRATEPAGKPESPVIFVVDDDAQVREVMRTALESRGMTVAVYASCEAFIESYDPSHGGCLLVDAYLPGMSGVELLRRMRDAGYRLPAIMLTGSSDISTAVQAMKAGAFDFIEKPVGNAELFDSIGRALEQSQDSNKPLAWQEAAANHIRTLTLRQQEIMKLVVAGLPSKNIAADLGISQRTVENHRAAIMKKTGAKSLPALARLVFAATWNGAGDPFDQ